MNPLYDNIKWVWLDLDDTLYDFQAASLIALGKVHADLNLGRFFRSVDEWIDIYHRHNSALWKLYNRAEITKEFLKMERFRRPLVEAGADDATARQLSLQLDPLYLDLLGRAGCTIPGAIELLQSLHSNGFKVGILSNGFTEVQHKKLHSSGIAPYVDCVVLSDEIGINKPDRRLFDYALQKAGTTASAALMIGDNPDTDIAGATAAGWRARLFNPAEDSLYALLP